MYKILIYLITFTFAISQDYSLNFENDSHVTVPHSDNLDFGENDPMSISFWIIKSSSAEMHILGKRAGQNNCTFQIGASGNSIGIGGYPIGWWDELSMTSPTITETWTHVVFTFDGDMMSGYLNGMLEGSSSGSSLGPKSTVPLEIGTLQWGQTHDLFDGLIDEVGIWNRALTQEEVQSYMFTPPTGDEDGLVSYWNFNEGTGTTVHDITGNSNNGTIINEPQWSTDVPFSDGCTDPYALNYDETANIDDGSCTYPVNGDYSLGFDGLDDYVETPLFRNILIDFTIEGRFRYDGDPLDDHKAIFGGASSNFFIGKNNYNSGIHVQDGSDLGSATEAFTDGEFHHVAYSFLDEPGPGGHAWLFIDGELLAEGYMLGGEGAIWFGRENQNDGFPFLGLLDDVRISNTNRYMESFIPTVNYEMDEFVMAHYIFNEGEETTLFDHSGNQNHGIIHGNPVWLENIEGCMDFTADNYDASANVNGGCTYPDNGDYSLSFDGVDDYIDLGDIGNIFPVTYELWFKPAQDIQGSLDQDQYLLSKDGNGLWTFRIALLMDGRIGLGIGGTQGGGSWVYSSNSTWMADTFYHITATVDHYNNDELEMKIYLDGQIQNSYITVNTIQTNNYSTFAGTGVWADEGWFNGNIDEISIWNVALDESEIEENHQMSDGLIAYYKFNTGLGEILHDHSGNGNHGDIYGATWECNEEIDACGVCGGDNSSCPIVTDIDGNIYATVQIGNQNWMKQNLKVTHYNDGDDMPNITNNGEWVNLSTGAYAVYNGDPVNADIYGNLYNWYAANDEREICPQGWHMPSDDEWTILIDYLGGASVAGGKMKSTGTVENGDGLWDAPNESATNESGFTSLPAGWRHSNSGLDYEYVNDKAVYWSTYSFNDNNAHQHVLESNHSQINIWTNGKKMGNSIRCVENVEGCTDSVASNYDETANVDDDSCTYPDTGDYSLSFDGIDDYVELGSSNSFVNSSYTMQMNVKISNDPTVNNMSLLGSGPASNGNFWSYIRNDRKLSISHWQAGEPIGTEEIQNDSWHTITFTFNNSNNESKIFVDGIFDGSSILNGSFYNSGTILLGTLQGVHMDAPEWQGWLNGMVDYVAIWNTNLDQEEIQTNINNDINANGENLVGYWKFNAGDENILYDHSGNQNHGTVYGATWIENIEGCTDESACNHDFGANIDDGSCNYDCHVMDDYVLEFDGSGDYVNIGNSELLSTLNDFSIGFWFNSSYSASSGDWIYILGKRDYYHFELFGDGVIRFGLTTSSGDWALIDSDPGYNDGKWHWVVATRNSSSGIFNLYIDEHIALGEYQGSDYSDMTGSVTSNHDFLIGLHHEGHHGPFYGKIDELKIWNEEFSEEEVLYWTCGSNCDDNLIGHWMFDEGMGTILHDHSGNSLHGEVFGAAWWGPVVLGCMDSLANNYNENANVNNGCEYPDNGDYSLSFDGDDDWVLIGGLNGMDPTSSHTMMFRLKYITQNSDHMIISELDASAATNEMIHYGFRTGNDQDCMGMDFYDNNLITQQSYPETEWTHWALSYDKETLQRIIYRNGEIVASDISNGQYSGDLNMLLAAQKYDHNSNMGGFYSGLLDEMLIFNYPLELNQIQSYMSMPVVDNESGLIANWKFNAGEGTTLFDHSGNQNHGSINGAKWRDDNDSIHSIPNEYDTIQDGINASQDGDTVFVSVGNYEESISFNGKNIAVIGENKDSTIINGNGQISSIVKFISGENSSTLFKGFTIKNGNGGSNGGGIVIQNSSPRLDDLLIMDNIGAHHGGGIGVHGNGTPVISNSIIRDNESITGGGIYCTGSDLTIQNVLVINNHSTNDGGGLTASNCSPELLNVTILNNSTINEGDQILNTWGGTSTIMKNSIVLGEIYNRSGGTIDISYSNVTGFSGNGNINEDPQFNDPSIGDYSLQSTSPCIDSGDPDVLDPDGTRSDMGAYYFHQISGCTDQDAIYQDSDAVINDGSCEYPDNGDYSLSFDGVDNYAYLLKDELADELSADGFSLSLWLKSTSTSGDDLSRLVSRDCSDYWCVIVNQSQEFPQNLQVASVINSSEVDVIYESVIDSGWNHIAVTFDSSEDLISIFLNGDFLGTQQYGEPIDSERPILISGNTEAEPQPNTDPFEGYVDNVSFYDKVLNQEEISNVMDSLAFTQENGLYAYYSFNAGDGDILYDRSGNLHHGERHGATWECDGFDFCGICGGDNSSCRIISDIDGNSYGTVEIGEQTWMRQNLKSMHYNNGDEIPTGLDDSEWSNTMDGAYSVYDDEISNADIYGNLYNWFSIDDERGICPVGFHVPSDGEFMDLEMFLGMSSEDLELEGWRGTNQGFQLKDDMMFDGSNSTGFSALPTGSRHVNGYYDEFNYIYSNSIKLSNNYIRVRYLEENQDGIWRGAVMPQQGVAIRCLEDEIDIASSTEMSAYYFSSITLDGISVSDGDVIIAKNDSTGIIVGQGLHGNAGNGYTEVFVYGEMNVEGETFGTDGYMLDGQIPQFHVNGIRANHVASDGALLQDIPFFHSLDINYDLTLHLVTDCNDDMGGAAVTSGICGDCWGGNTGVEKDYMDPDEDGICNEGASNGDADNCPDAVNSDQNDLDDDLLGDECDDCPLDPNNDIDMDEVCGDVDNCPDMANTDQANNDGDEDGDLCDIDDDNDGCLDDVDDAQFEWDDNYDGDENADDCDDDDDDDGSLDDDDDDDNNEFACNDDDGDTCDECTSGTHDSFNDGWDYDGDGACDAGDDDDDDDGALDDVDSNDNDEFACSDDDGDTCDDCSDGSYGLDDDGADNDVDGICDAGDDDDDNDGVVDDLDTDPFDNYACGDDDGDTCEDCLSGYHDINDDGWDYDGDGACDDGDDDDDNDGALDEVDSDDNNEFACSDDDGDTCDDCSDGSYGLDDDGIDNDGDGWCNDGDAYPDCAYDNANDPSVYPEEIDVNPYDECGNCHGDGFEASCVDTDDCEDMDCAGECGQAAYLDDCGTCDDFHFNDCIDLTFYLHGGANLISFPALPEDLSVSSIFDECMDEDGEGMLGQGVGTVIINGTWIGSLTHVDQEDGYWVILNESCDLHLDDAIPVNHDDDGEVVYGLEYGPNLVSYSHMESQGISEGLGDAQSSILAVLGEGQAALNTVDGWVGGLLAFEKQHGYWILALEDLVFSYEEPSESMTRASVQPKPRVLPEPYGFIQSMHQAFFFIETAEIDGMELEEDDILIAYNGDVVVGARYWLGQYTDVPAMGHDGYNDGKGYAKTDDEITFKVLDASSQLLIDMEVEGDNTWNNLGVSIISLVDFILPEAFALEAPYPNPFNPVTRLSFSLPERSAVSLSIYDLQGREVSSILSGMMDAGYHSMDWDASNHGSGMYFVKMVAGSHVQMQKLMLIK